MRDKMYVCGNERESLIRDEQERNKKKRRRRRRRKKKGGGGWRERRERERERDVTVIYRIYMMSDRLHYIIQMFFSIQNK